MTSPISKYTPEQKKAVFTIIAKKLGAQAGLALGHKALKTHLRGRASRANAASVNPETTARIQQIAKERYGLNTDVVRVTNPQTLHDGPVFIPSENAVIGPGEDARRIRSEQNQQEAGNRLTQTRLQRFKAILRPKKTPIVATLDDPAVLAHELGHAMAFKQTPWTLRVQPVANYVGNTGALAGVLGGSPAVAALMTAVKGVPQAVEERRANINARKLLNAAVGRTEASRLLKANHAIELSGIAKTIADSFIAYALTNKRKVAPTPKI